MVSTANVLFISIRLNKTISNFCALHKVILRHAKDKNLVSLIPSGTSYFVAEFRDSLGYTGVKRALGAEEIDGSPVIAEKFGENISSRPQPVRPWIIECSVTPRYQELHDAIGEYFQGKMAEEEVAGLTAGVKKICLREGSVFCGKLVLTPKAGKLPWYGKHMMIAGGKRLITQEALKCKLCKGHDHTTIDCKGQLNNVDPILLYPPS